MRLSPSSSRLRLGRYRGRPPLWLMALMVLGCPACERAAPPDNAAVRSPRETIQRIIAAREAGSYQTLNELIVRERTHEVVKTLMAVDEFLHANKTLCDYVRGTFALGLSQSIDQSHWGAHLDIFRRHLELIDQRIEGDTATVTFTVDGRIPVRRARLV